jgi:ATP-dependent Lhr-like helicase
MTREAALGEGVQGGFAAVYGVLKVMEESGKVRRGYFVSGLGAAQFALPGAVDRLRDLRDPRGRDIALTLAATDPAQPFGMALPWPDVPGRPARTAGAYVILQDGQLAAFLERGARSLLTFPAAERDDAWVDALVSLAKEAKVRRIELQRIDGVPFGESRWATRLREAGFADGYRGLVLRD